MTLSICCCNKGVKNASYCFSFAFLVQNVTGNLRSSRSSVEITGNKKKQNSSTGDKLHFQVLRGSTKLYSECPQNRILRRHQEVLRTHER